MVIDGVRPLPAERLALSAALGRVLAAPLRARDDAPPFDASAMDGYAVRAADLAGSLELPLAGESRAGSASPPLAPGHAMRISTGAPLPEGADAVVIQEETERHGDRLRVRAAVLPGANVRRRGEDHREGAGLLEAGCRLGSGELGLVASQSVARIDVHRAPAVAILVNGDELRDPGDPILAGSIVDSNGPMLAAAVREAGGVPRLLPRAPDEAGAMLARVREGLDADLLLVVGGASVGDHDLARPALGAAGVEEKFAGVAMKPGKPLAFGIGPRGVPVFGLPGNPVGAWVAFTVFVAPAIRRLAGDASPFAPCIEVRLGRAARPPHGRTELARARLERGAGLPVAHLHPRQGSASLASLVASDALVLLGPADGPLEAGATARALDLRAPGTPAFPFPA